MGGVVEGVNNTIRVTQRRCYALGDEKSLRLKMLIGILDLYEVR